MKTTSLVSSVKITSWSFAVTCLFFGAVSTRAQKNGAGIESTEPVVVERGLHHRVWQRAIIQPLPGGRSITNRSSVVELESGMHYVKDGQWLESREEVEILNGAAVARQGQHQVIFAANINSPGAIDLLAPDGQRFRSHVLGLVYTDYASGKSVMIAEVKDSIGQVLPPNQVIYTDAFDGDCVADLRYTYTKAGFEQDVILRTTPPSPAEWGLNPETSRMEVFTEFLEAPQAKVTSVMLKQETDEAARQTMREPDLIDQRLDFGGMSIGQGQAFPLRGRGEDFSDSAVPTGKSLEKIDGRLILIEKVDYAAVREHLGRLPKSAFINKQRKVGLPDPGRTMLASLLPGRPIGVSGKWRDGQYAKVDTTRKGFVLDYVTVNSSLTNYLLKGDTTYLATNTVNFYGTTILEGGVVIKFATNGQFNVYGAVDCRTAPYRPATFTSKDDNTIGEVMSGSTGIPGLPAVHSFYCRDTTTTNELHDLRVFYSQYGVTAGTSVKLNVNNLQITKSTRGVAMESGSLVQCRNFLFTDLTDGFYLTGTTTNRSEHGTMHRVTNYRSSTNGLFTLTNSLLISVTNNIVLHQSANVVTNVSDTGFFQTVGAATHYLASGSTNRDAGTTNINTTLLADLKKKTTYPPVVIGDGGYYTNTLTLYPQAQRDTDTPDIGYHYEPLDYVINGVTLTNASITAMPGVAMGIRTIYSTGFGLLGGSALYCEGTPDNLNRIVRYNMVQEQSNTNWTDYATSGAYNIGTSWSSTVNAPILRLRFTEFSVAAASAETMYHIYGFSEDYGSHSIRDCQFHNGDMWSFRPTFNITNCLFNRTRVIIAQTDTSIDTTFRNSTFVGGDLQLYNDNTGTWTFKDNLFDGTTTYIEGTITNSYNAYTTNATRLTPTNVNDVKLSVTNVTYATGRLGSFYLPTNLTSHSTLFNSGSWNATNAGLYHYTTTTNQLKETNSVVDIGFHYVAVNSSGAPLDSDGDGLGDYLEDVNGNGSKESTETGWLSAISDADTDGDGVSDYLEVLLGRNPLVAGSTNDNSGTLNLRLYTPLR